MRSSSVSFANQQQTNDSTYRVIENIQKQMEEQYFFGSWAILNNRFHIEKPFLVGEIPYHSIYMASSKLAQIFIDTIAEYYKDVALRVTSLSDMSDFDVNPASSRDGCFRLISDDIGSVMCISDVLPGKSKLSVKLEIHPKIVLNSYDSHTKTVQYYITVGSGVSEYMFSQTNYLDMMLSN